MILFSPNAATEGEGLSELRLKKELAKTVDEQYEKVRFLSFVVKVSDAHDCRTLNTARF